MTGSVFFKGGLLMYPLLLCSVFSIALILEKSIMLTKLRIKSSVYGEILSLAEKRNFNKLNKLITKYNNGGNPPAMQFISDIINGLIKSSDEYKMLIGVVVIKYSERIHYLDLIARISPMIGLTGTVIGLAKTFQAVSSTGVSADPVILAGGIWEAMITTITGLLIAIPALAASHILKNLINSYSAKTKSLCDAVFIFRNND